MKTLRDICLEASILDIEGTIEDGNKYIDVDLNKLIKAKSEEEFNIYYDILKDIVTTEEKEPPTKTRYIKKYITSGNDNLYIKFQIYYGKYGEKKSITIGGEKTVNFTWNIFLDKVFDVNCFSKFSEIDLTNCECVRYLPKKWYKQAQKIINNIK